MHEGKGLLHTSLFYQAATDLYKRTNLRCCSNRIDDDYADRAVAPLPSGDRRLVDARIKRGPRRVELIVTGSAKDVGVFPSG